MNERPGSLSHFGTEYHFDRPLYNHWWLAFVIPKLNQHLERLTPRRKLVSAGSFELLHSEHEFRFIFAIVHLRSSGMSRSTHNITLSTLLLVALVGPVVLEVLEGLVVLVDLVDRAIHPTATSFAAHQQQLSCPVVEAQTVSSSGQASWYPLQLSQNSSAARSFLGPHVAVVDPIGVQIGHLTAQHHHGAGDSF